MCIHGKRKSSCRECERESNPFKAIAYLLFKHAKAAALSALSAKAAARTAARTAKRELKENGGYIQVSSFANRFNGRIEENKPFISWLSLSQSYLEKYHCIRI